MLVIYYRLFFLHCYDPVWFKELDLKPYWSLVCTRFYIFACLKGKYHWGSIWCHFTNQEMFLYEKKPNNSPVVQWCDNYITTKCTKTVNECLCHRLTGSKLIAT